MIYILALLITLCLSTAQALWASTVKSITSANRVEIPELIISVIKFPRFWIGALLYVLSIGIYFILLSKAKFFSVQITMTAVAIIMSVLISHFFFKEYISGTNIAGIILVMAGIVLVTR